MAFYSAFQRNAFWHKNYQIAIAAPAAPAVPTQDSGRRRASYQENRQEYQQKVAKVELRRVDDELAEAERKRLEAIAAQEKAKKKAALKLAALQVSLEEEISRLRIERIWLMRWIDEQEAMLILLMMGKRRLRLVSLN